MTVAEWITSPRCRRCPTMALGLYDLEPLCHQHLLVAIGETIPRNRAEARAYAKAHGIPLGRRRRRPSLSKRRSRRPLHPRWLIQDLEDQEREAERRERIAELTRGVA